MKNPLIAFAMAVLLAGIASAQWSVPVDVSNNAGDSAWPAIAADAGTVYVAWDDWTTGNDDIFLSKSTDGGFTWSTQLNVSNDAGRSEDPAIAIDSGTLYLVWDDDEFGNYEVLYSNSTDGGVTWSAAVNVSNTDGSSYSPTIAIDAGTIHAAWYDDTSGNWEIFYSKSTDGGATWSPAVNVSNNLGWSDNPAIVADSGAAYLTWHDDTSGNNEIFYSKSTDGGVTWSTPLNVSNNTGSSYSPTVVIDAGTIRLAWADSTPGNWEIFYSESTDGGATWSTLVNVSNNAGLSFRPRIAIEGGTIHLAWLDYAPGNGDIFYSNSTDGGATWSSAVNVSNSLGDSNQNVIVISAGAIHMAWMDNTPGNLDIFYSRYPALLPPVGDVLTETVRSVPESTEIVLAAFLLATTIFVLKKK
jgi:Neuraminidase (sialidase)